MLIYKKIIPVIEVGIATLIILFIPHNPQSIISCLTLTFPILLSIILVKIQALMEDLLQNLQILTIVVQVNHHMHPHIPVTDAVVRKVLQTVMFQILCTLQF